MPRVSTVVLIDRGTRIGVLSRPNAGTRKKDVDCQAGRLMQSRKFRTCSRGVRLFLVAGSQEDCSGIGGCESVRVPLGGYSA